MVDSTVSKLPTHIRCHECGRWFKSLGHHIAKAHGLSAHEYRERHGIPPGESISAPALLASKQASAIKLNEANRRMELEHQARYGKDRRGKV